MKLLQGQWFWYGALLSTAAASSWVAVTGLEFAPVGAHLAFGILQVGVISALCRVQIQTQKAERYLQTLSVEKE